MCVRWYLHIWLKIEEGDWKSENSNQWKVFEYIDPVKSGYCFHEFSNSSEAKNCKQDKTNKGSFTYFNHHLFSFVVNWALFCCICLLFGFSVHCQCVDTISIHWMERKHLEFQQSLVGFSFTFFSLSFSPSFNTKIIVIIIIT